MIHNIVLLLSVMCALHCTFPVVLCGVQIDRTLNVGRVQAGEAFSITCITRDSDRLTWSSEEYIGRNSLTLAFNGSMESPNSYTTATLVRYDSGGSIELISELSIIVQPNIPFASLTCHNDVTLEMQSINISLIDNPIISVGQDESYEVCPGQIFTAFCDSQGSSAISWISVTRNGDIIVTLSADNSVDNSSTTTAEITRNTSRNGIQVLQSQFSIMVTEDIIKDLRHYITCVNEKLQTEYTVGIRMADNCGGVQTTTTLTPQDTTDVQTVQVVFFRNHLFLQCSFVGSSQARGCVFMFTVISTNRIDRYNVTRQDGSVCTSAPYRLDAYGSIVVVDREESGVEGSVPLNITNTNFVMNVSSAEEYMALTGCPVTEPTSNVGAVVSGIVVGIGLPIIIAITVVIVVIVFKFAPRKKQTGSAAVLTKSKSIPRVASDSGDSGYRPVLYECEINAGEFEGIIKKATTASGPPPPPTFRYLSDKETIEMEHTESASFEPPPPPITGVIEMEPEVCEETKEAASSGPSPPPISGEISSTGVIEMPEESTASRAPPRSRVVGDYDSPEASDDEATAESAPPLKDEDKRVEQEIERRVKEELDKRVAQELDERVKQELDKRVKQEVERVKQELEERVTRELDEKVEQEVQNRLAKEVNERVKTRS